MTFSYKYILGLAYPTDVYVWKSPIGASRYVTVGDEDDDTVGLRIVVRIVE